ncbi:hypothetical protein CC78DRAFT_533862 [Lojkania enalia]|uniref:Uncharacterized protein n=1 Tax=Lojkania enalia TaxID=147567 RepID=A0A9P4K6P0_9PLEO|nr:hypothetical protein CC78DRAFT_533862 [Didymosphaeria enalia]
MKPFSILAAVSALSSEVAAHATFQQLWVNGKDLISASALRMESKLTLLYGSTCARLPNSNNPVTSVTSNDVRCKCL